MGVPASEVGYTPAMPRREDHKVHKDMWWHWGGGIDCRYEICNRLSTYLVSSYFINVSVFPLVTIQPDGGLHEWPKHEAGFLKSSTQ